MVRLRAAGRWALPWTGAALALLALLACTPPWSGPPRQTPTPTPQIGLEAQPSPTPIKEETKPPDGDAASGATILEGRPYLREALPGAVVYYEPQVGSQVIAEVAQAYAVTQRLLLQELGASVPKEVAFFLSGEDQFTRLGSAHGFPDTSHLLGFYSPSPKEVEGAAAGVYLNADGESLFHTLGHELTHAAVPGLPSWFSEGLADYIGTRVEKAMNPKAQSPRAQAFRRLVRGAVKEGTLLDQRALETFDLRADHTCLDLDRFYGQAWHLLEYVGRLYGPYALQGLVASFRDNTHRGDPFETVLGIPLEVLWQEFSADIVDNLTVEERVDQSLDDLARLASKATAVTRDWNQFSPEAEVVQSGMGREQVRGFVERWQALALAAAETPAPGEASIVRNLWLLYFQAMAGAIERFAAGEIDSANQRLAYANQQYAAAAITLQDALGRRPGVICS